MDKKGFEGALKRRGKKTHVIAELIRQVEAFEKYLIGKGGKSLAAAEAQDIRDYADTLESRQPGSARKAVRGVALYFHFAGRVSLADAASALREGAIAKTRTAFPLREFLGICPGHVTALGGVGVVNARQMLEAGKTPFARRGLVSRSGVPEEVILELVKLSDLSRIEGVKAVRARLYYDVGVDTVEKMAAYEPDGLLELTANFIRRTGFDGIAPLPKEVLHSIETARKLPKIVVYD